MKREEIQTFFIRVCRDGGFKLDGISAAIITAKVIGCSPLEIWMAMPSLSVMNSIADGTHPAANDNTANQANAA